MMGRLNLQREPYNSGTFFKCISEDQAQNLANEKPLTKTQWIVRGNKPDDIAYLKHVFRMSPNIESENIQNIVRSIHECKAHELFDIIAPLFKAQPNSDKIGNGNHQFLNLQECACSVLDRVTKPGIRAEYEKQVLAKIDALPEAMAEIPISIFAPGMLFGEFVLLVKILNLLETKNWCGELKLFFIDTEYSSAQAYTLLDHQSSVENRKTIKIAIDIQNICMRKIGEIQETPDYASEAIGDFFNLLQQIAIPSIKIKSFFFENKDHYTQLSNQNPKFKNVLQIGSDIDNNRATVEHLVKNTQVENGVGMVVLVPRPVLNQDGTQKVSVDGVKISQPMIFFMETQAAEVQHNWLDQPNVPNYERNSF